MFRKYILFLLCKKMLTFPDTYYQDVLLNFFILSCSFVEKRYKDGGKNNNGGKIWSSNWNVRSSDDTQEQESISDVLSQCSDSTTNESCKYP